MNAWEDSAGTAMTDWPDEQGKSPPYAYGAMHDGLGKRRIEMVTGASEMTWFRYGLGWKPLSAHDGATSAFWTLGARNVTCVSLGHTMLAMALGANPVDPALTVDFITDHLGSTRGILYGTDFVYEAEYTPYGDFYWDNGPLFGFGFTGHYYDQDTQLYYAPYRWYSPQTARWTTRDPLGMVDGPNVYAYVEDNPLQLADPMGLSIVITYPPPGMQCRSRESICEQERTQCLAAAHIAYGLGVSALGEWMTFRYAWCGALAVKYGMNDPRVKKCFTDADKFNERMMGELKSLLGDAIAGCNLLYQDCMQKGERNCCSPGSA